MFDDRDSRKKHSVPAVMVQTKTTDGIPCIEMFCNKPIHLDCVNELNSVLRNGGFVVARSYWAKYYKKG